MTESAEYEARVARALAENSDDPNYDRFSAEAAIEAEDMGQAGSNAQSQAAGFGHSVTMTYDETTGRYFVRCLDCDLFVTATDSVVAEVTRDGHRDETAVG